MNAKLLAGLLFATSVANSAVAQDSRDPALDSAHARDREQTRQLNMTEGAKVRERDARYAQGWVSHPRGEAAAAYQNRIRDYERNMADYRQDNARYDQQMDRWRRAVAACRQGDVSACEQ